MLISKGYSFAQKIVIDVMHNLVFLLTRNDEIGLIYSEEFANDSAEEDELVAYLKVIKSDCEECFR